MNIAEKPSINAMRLDHLRNGAHFRLHTEFRDLVEKTGPARLKIEALWPEYSERYGGLDAALKNIVKGALANKLKNANTARDAVFSGLVKFHKVMCEHFDPAVRDAAHRIQAVLSAHGGIAAAPLNDDTAAVRNLVQELKTGKNSVLATIAGLTPWVNKLGQLNNDFEALIQERDREESASKNHLDMKTARHEIDEAYRRVVQTINSFIPFEQSTDYDAFVDALNAIIQDFSTKYLRHRHAANDAETPFD